MSRKWSFFWVLGVIGASIVFGMVIGGKLNAPRVMLAAPGAAREPATLSAAYSSPATGATNFADVVESSLGAVVQIVATSVRRSPALQDDPHEMFRDHPFFQFFGPPDRRNRQSPPEERREQSGGSGFLVSPDGYVLTNNHVIDGAAKVDVSLNDGSRFSAEIVGTDPNIDLALLKIDPRGRELPSLPLGDSDRLRIGEWVIAIGNPFQLSETVTVGVVSAKDRQVPIGDTDAGLVNFIQTDAAINFGNSGGPLLDAAGHVVGINTAINREMMAEGIGFALPINQARSAMEQLRETGKVRRGYLGIGMMDINEAAQEYNRLPDRNGVFVQSVNEGGPADEAGLKEGDILRKVDGFSIRNGRDLLGKVAPRKPGERVRLEGLRAGRPLSVEVVLGTRPDAQELAAGGRGGDSRGESPDSPSESENFGIRVETLSPAWRERLGIPDSVSGVYVAVVEAGSEADSVGIAEGLVITSVNDVPISGISAWREVVEKLEAGGAVKIKAVAPGGASRVFFFMPIAKSD